MADPISAFLFRLGVDPIAFVMALGVSIALGASAFVLLDSLWR